jgi:hypothetical protein
MPAGHDGDGRDLSAHALDRRSGGAEISLIGDGVKAKVSASWVVAQRLDRIAIVAGDLDRRARLYSALGFVVDDALSY